MVDMKTDTEDIEDVDKDKKDMCKVIEDMNKDIEDTEDMDKYMEDMGQVMEDRNKDMQDLAQIQDIGQGRTGTQRAPLPGYGKKEPSLIWTQRAPLPNRH